MKTFIETQKNALLRKYHALLRRGGVNDEERLALLSAYGVESAKELNVYELTELCDTLCRAVQPNDDADRWRKRLIAAIDEYLRAMGHRGGNLPEIKAVACRAAQAENFNRIGTDRLKSLYNAFKRRTADLHQVDAMTDTLILQKMPTATAQA